MIFASRIEQTFQRFSKLKRTKKTVVFPVITDLHSILEDIDPCEPGLRNSLNVIEALHQADTLFDFDFFADLGDTGLGLPHNRPAAKGHALLQAYASAHRQTEKPFFVCMGNHDYEKNVSDSQSFGEIMNRINLHRGHAFHFGENASYGFFDLPEKEVRIFFLNTGDGNPYGLDQTQLVFLEKSLQLPSGWHSLIFMHKCPHKNGNWVSENEKPVPESFLRFERIVKNAGNVGGIFCGDSHFDTEFRIGTIPGFVSQGYGGVAEKSMPEGARKNPFNSREDLLAEIVVYDPEMKRIEILRLGVKDAAADRSGEPSLPGGS